MDRFIFTFQDSCENVTVTTFTPSDNGGKQAFTVTGYTLSDYVDVGDDLAFTYSGNYYVYTIIDITGNQITMSFDYNASITNVNTSLQFSIKVTCSPYDFNKGKFEWNKDSVNYFYKMKYSGKVRFKGDDYDYLVNALFENCCEVIVKVYKYCENDYSLYYRSRINKTEGTWNESQCWFETELTPLDKYKCISDVIDNDVDIYQIDRVSIGLQNLDSVADVPFLEYIVVATAPVSAGTTFDNGDGGNLFIEINTPSGESVDPVTGNAWTVYARAKRVFIVDGGLNYVAPDPLNGYDLLSSVFEDGKWVNTYTKQVTATNMPEIGTYINGAGCDLLTPVSGARLYDPINDNCISLVNSTIATSTQYNSVPMDDVLELMVLQCNNISGATSDFFEINPIGDTTGYVSGENYVTGLTNILEFLNLSHIADILNPTASTPAQVLNLSLGELLKNLNYMFNSFWFIDIENRLRIEHDSWFTNNVIINLSLTANNMYKKVYSYIKEQIPNREKFTFKYSLLSDNKGTDIVYDQICTNSPLILERQSTFVTDLYYLRNSDSGNFSSDSIVMIAAVGDVIYEEGFISGVFFANGHLGWANLHEAYHRYGRILETGRMNFNDVTFDSWRKLRKQSNQKYIGCCLDIPENQGNVITELGTGDATKISYDINSNTFEFELNI